MMPVGQLVGCYNWSGRLAYGTSAGYVVIRVTTFGYRRCQLHNDAIIRIIAIEGEILPFQRIDQTYAGYATCAGL